MGNTVPTGFLLFDIRKKSRSRMAMSALECVGQDDVENLKLVCELYAQANNNRQQYDIETKDNYGNTALLKSCYMGSYKCASILLHYGANIRAMNNLAQNALTLATHAGNLSLIRELLLYRSYHDFNLSSIIPALCVATLRQNQELIKFFESLDKQHDMDIHTVHGLYPQDIRKMLTKVEEKTEYALDKSFKI